MKKILITGAAGHIGKVLRRGLAGRYELLRLSDIAPMEPAGAHEEVVTADVQDLAAVRAAVAGIDCIVHLGAIANEAGWERILPINIVGTYNVFEAAREAGVKRVVFASSNHAIGFYRRSRRIDADAGPRPDTRYGLSKAFGEGLGRLYADKHGMEVVSLRIGTCRERPVERRHLSTWISHRDMIELVRCSIEAPNLHYAVAYGVSDNPRGWWDNTLARQNLGFIARDSAEAFAAELLGKEEPPDPVAALFHGGPYCADEFNGDASRID